MTKNEATDQLESLLDHCKTMRESGEIWARDCEALRIALAALRGPTREQVSGMKKELVKGPYDEWWCPTYTCPECGWDNPEKAQFCCNCGCPFTDEAVDIVMERLEALKDEAIHGD